MTSSSPPQLKLWHNHQHSWLESDADTALTNADRLPDTLVVEAIASQISVGTERLVTSGQLSTDCVERMRIPYMLGSFDQSFTYGYSLVGKVLEGPAEFLGRRVHLLHPHQRYAVVTSADATVIPDALDSDTATLISNMETAVTAVWDAGPAVGDQIVIFGFGLIGTLVAQLLRRIPGLDLTIVEPNSARATLAHESGLKVQPTAGDLANADLAFSTAAEGEALQQAIDCLRTEGTVVELSWHGSRRVSLNLGGSFHYDRKRLISSQVGRLPASQGHWDFKRRKQLVMQLLLECKTLPAVEQRIDFTDTPAFYAQLRKQRPVSRHIVIDY
ncbi:MAG: zinc-binding alcohol dehydrogenase [Gammaproteobacteria bacterium]|nr:zinc-binding alcohol dehydrogenase [Gammaproteobacteria bacterium]